MTTRPAVHQVLATLGYGDAIAHEALGIQRVLRRAGFESDIFVETADTRVESLTRDYRDLLDGSHPDNLLIHHFSIGSKASRIAYALPDRMALVYHNITPPEFFIDVHRLLVQQCYNGRRELRAYTSRCELALGDSAYNRDELESLGFPVTGILPVVPDLSHLDVQPRSLTAAAFDDEWVNILFVGRVIPSKRPDDLIRFFSAYKRWHNPRSRLLIVGSYGGFEGYLAQLHHLVRQLGVSDIHIVGQVTDEELVAYYAVADLYLCASEHEGFCVPIIEAFYTRVPVLAFATTAVPATMDGGGLLYDSKDAVQVAALMDAVLSDVDLQERVLRSQDAALDRLVGQDFGGTLLRFVDRALTEPRRGIVDATDDFWHQFEQTEELAERRLERPALYAALPQAPEPGR